MHSLLKRLQILAIQLFYNKLKYEQKEKSLTLEPPNKKGCQSQQKGKEANKEHLFPGQVEVI